MFNIKNRGWEGYKEPLKFFFIHGKEVNIN